MNLAIDGTDHEVLNALGRQCVQLLRDGNFEAVAQLFGYAVAFDRPASLAIAADLQMAITDAGASNLVPHIDPELAVVRFKPEQELLAIVECRLRTNEGSSILVELVVTRSDGRAVVCLEQISAVA